MARVQVEACSGRHALPRTQSQFFHHQLDLLYCIKFTPELFMRSCLKKDLNQYSYGLCLHIQHTKATMHSRSIHHQFLRLQELVSIHPALHIHQPEGNTVGNEEDIGEAVLVHRPAAHVEGYKFTSLPGSD